MEKCFASSKRVRSFADERADADDAAALAHVGLLRQMDGERFEVGAQVERLHLRAVVGRGVAFVLGERPVHAELVLEVVERAERLVDALALVAQTLRGIFDGRDGDGIIVAAVEAALRVARGCCARR